MKKLTVGILAHVDAGKTTLSESMLYLSGKIRKIGRVDNKDAYLDTYELEKQRGITIFSKQAVMQFDDTEITLLDTPGHVDFSAEMERTLQVLDYAILVISGADGVQNHTKTVWELLEYYKVPTFIFVNKMDQAGTSRDFVMASIHKNLSDRCIVFDGKSNTNEGKLLDKESQFKEERDETLALCDERVMESYIETGRVSDEQIQNLVAKRKAFPVYFGSALKQEGTKAFVQGLIQYSKRKDYPSAFGAKVFKISRDEDGNRLTHLKITGGQVKVKDTIELMEQSEKINQIRVYSGEKYHTESILKAGAVCAVTGLSLTRPGQGLGTEKKSTAPQLEPVLSYQVVLPDDVSERQILPKLRELEEEEPELRVLWNEVHQSIHIQVMGAVQLEILQSLIEERYGVLVSYGHGEIVYKETVASRVEGVGHFEPLRHYAEVHLLIEPGERGSGMTYGTRCSEDILDKNWQNLVLTHLNEKTHTGVLIGAQLTDVKVTLVSGRAHNKHTAGGDFRQATFRALRQGLMEAECLLLEPYYKFKLVLPEQMVGRAMTDVDKMYGTCTLEQTDGEMAIISGVAPVSRMQNYQQDLHAYTKGEGRLSIAVKGYDICHNADEIIEQVGYDPELDVGNPTGSVFCSKGTGYYVPWDEVKSHMHVEAYLKAKKGLEDEKNLEPADRGSDDFISLEEIDSIINSTHFANQGRKNIWKRKGSAKESHYLSLASPKHSYQSRINTESDEEYLLVDGYNIIHAWPELEEISRESMEGARLKLIDILSNYQPIRKCKIMLVFDAYRVQGRKESVEEVNNIQVVYTGEAQTADHFIEKFAHANKRNYKITVATSDGLQQIIIRGAGANLLSARDLKHAVDIAEERLHSEHLSGKIKIKDTLSDALPDEIKEKLQADMKDENSQ